MAASRIAIGLVMVGVAAVAAFMVWQGQQRPAHPGAARMAVAAGGGDARGVVRINVEGMSCVGCANSVEEEIEKVPGVAAVAVDFDARLAEVRLSDSTLSPATLVAAIEEAGYRAQVQEP